MKKLLIFLTSLFLIAQVEAQLPRVIILATGGTIAGAGASADRAGYTAGKIPIEDLIGAIPTVKKIASITGEQLHLLEARICLLIYEKACHSHQ
jgi:L-asparaginase